jgi:two-component system sensor histidine kinase BarA
METGRPPQAIAGHIARPKILLVEDDRSISFLIKRILEKCDVEVITAENGFAAIDACKKEKMDMILMDIRMPEMNGYETSSQIKKTQAAHCDVPIIAITASICDVEFYTYGIDACLEKPLDTFELYKTINDRLGTLCRI